MADDGSAQSTNIWPLPKFRFEVKWDSTMMHFQEVSGLDVEAQPITYRHGDSALFSTNKMPGLKKFNEIKMNTIKRKPVTISLLDESGAPTMVWTLANAYPIKVTGTDLNAQGNEVAVETIVLSHEGLTIANA